MKKQFQILAATFISVAIVSCSKQGVENPEAAQKNAEEISTSSSSSNERGIVIDPLTVNLEGSFQFNGDLKDQTRKLADGIATTRSVTYTKDRKGKLNGALYLNGTYGVKLKKIPQQTHTSLSVWIKASSMAQLTTFIVASAGNGPYVFHGANQVGGSVGIGANGIVGGNAGIINTVWHHVVVTYDGQNVRVYLDNILKFTENSPGSIPSSLMDYFIAYYPEWEYWKGCIDDLRFYSRTLTAADVQKLYNL